MPRKTWQQESRGLRATFPAVRQTDHRTGRLGVGLLALLVCLSEAHSAPRLPSVEANIREEVRTATRLLGRGEPPQRVTAVLDLALLAQEAWEPVAFGNATQALLDAVDREGGEVTDLAASALQALPEQADLPDWAAAILDEQLRRIMARRNLRARLLACRVLLQVDPVDPESRETYAGLLNHQDEKIRAQARAALNGMDTERAAYLKGPIVARLKGDAESHEADRQFDAGLALWTLAQLSTDAVELARAEESLVRNLAGTRSAELGARLDRLLSTLERPPSLIPGRTWTEALRRIMEEQPPETALRAAVALALLAPLNTELKLAQPLQRALPGYLDHRSLDIRLSVADAVGRYDLVRFFSGAQKDENQSFAAGHSPPAIRFVDPVRLALTNVFALPTSAIKIRALGRLTVDRSFVEEHAVPFSQAITLALASADPGIRHGALAVGVVPVYNLPEAGRARDQLLENLVAYSGTSAEAAVELCLHPSLTNLNQQVLVERVADLTHSESSGSRRAAGIALLRWSSQRGASNPLTRLRRNALPAHFEALARDAHPSTAWLGVAGLLAAALNPDLESESDACRRRLENLLETSDPSVRCRFLTQVRGVNTLNRADAPPFPNPAHDAPFRDHAVTRKLLTGLLRERDALLQRQVLRATPALERVAP